MGVNFLVTIAAIMGYLNKARQAQEKLDEAAEKMNRAAQDVCERWEGDAAQAFAQEQKVLYDYCKQLHNVGNEYIDTVQRQVDKYSRAEEEAKNAIGQ